MYFFHLDPDKLSDEDWAARYNELVWIRKEIKKKTEQQ